MAGHYYVIMRKYYGLPDYLSTDLSEKEDCFSFDTEEEANHCIATCFHDGRWMRDERYGKCRHYVEERLAS